MSVFTAVRLRPGENSNNDWAATSSSTIANGEKEFRFDHVFSEQNNVSVYNSSCRQIVEQVVKGYNATIAAYGQSGSGKTHSLLGTKGEDGILQLAVQNLLELIQERESVQYMVKLSAIEIYNENLVDLLDADESKKCRLSDDKIYNKMEEIVESYDHFINLCRRAKDRRKVGSTELNQKSSRSHAVFQLVVESCTLDALTGKQMTIVSQLAIVDLAGSENTRTMKNAVQTNESKKINLSLLALSRVMSTLAERPKDTSAIPFRDSVLTRILKNVLGGNSKFLLFCCIRKHASTETDSTIWFGQKAKKMPNEAKKNVATENAALPALIAQIGDLKRQLEEQKKETADQDKQRLEELLKKVLNSRTENNAPQIDKPKRRHSIAFGGSSFNCRSRKVDELDWNALFRVEEEDGQVVDSGRSSRMSVEMKLDSDLLPIIEGSSNTQSTQTNGMWIEKSTYDTMASICSELKVQIQELQSKLAQKSEIAQRNEELRAENELLKTQLDKEQKLRESAEELFQRTILERQTQNTETAKEVDDMKKEAKEWSVKARIYKDKYVDMKKHGLNLLKEKDEKIREAQENLKKAEDTFKLELEKEKRASEAEKQKREKMQSKMEKANRLIGESLDAEKRLREEMREKLEGEKEVLEEKMMEMRLVSKGAVTVPNCSHPEHIRLLDKLDTLVRHRDLLVANMISRLNTDSQ